MERAGEGPTFSTKKREINDEETRLLEERKRAAEEAVERRMEMKRMNTEAERRKRQIKADTSSSLYC